MNHPEYRRAQSYGTRYKRLAVLTPDDEPTYLPRAAGKRLLIFFMRFPEGSEDVLVAYRAYQRLSAAERAGTQVAVVNRHTRAPAKLKAFFADNDIGFPLYFEGPGTCANLPCHDRFPYFMAINPAGRITEYYGWPEELNW